jgi:hypothetical protein
VNSTARTRRSALLRVTVLARTSRATSKLHNQALTHKVGTVEGRDERLTRNDVAGVHGVLVFEEAEAVHELDLGDLTSSMAGKVVLDIGLGG